MPVLLDYRPEQSSKKMTLISIHPGNKLEGVLATMGFRLVIPQQIPFTEPPAAEQLRLIQEEIDPERMVRGGQEK